MPAVAAKLSWNETSRTTCGLEPDHQRRGEDESPSARATAGREPREHEQDRP